MDAVVTLLRKEACRLSDFREIPMILSAAPDIASHDLPRKQAADIAFG